MVQSTDITLAPNITGTAQRTEINDILAAMLSQHSGASRPSYLTDPGMWAKEVSGTVTEWYQFDGTDDILIGTFDYSANTFTPAGQLATFGNEVTAKSAGFTAVAADFGKAFSCNATGGAITAAIDPTSGLGTSWYIIVQKTDSSANAVTVNPDGTDTVNGATTLALTRQWDAAIVIKSSASTFAAVLLPNGALLAPLASPALTGNPTAPTQSPGNNSTRIATTAYADAAIAALATIYATLASPALTGNPTAPTQSAGNNSTRIATTAFVATALSGVMTPCDHQDFTSSGTWSKPSGYSSTAMVLIECIGGGGGGSSDANAAFTAGSPGGSSSVGSLITAYGGTGGDNGASATAGGSGGGLFYTASPGQCTDIFEGVGAALTSAATSTYLTPSSGTITFKNRHANQIGGGGGGGVFGPGGNSVYGGGGGGGNTGIGTGSGGTSQFAGNGGSSGSAGTAPGGGGGGRNTTTSFGGGGGSYKWRLVPLSSMGATESVTVGSGGAGGGGGFAGARGEVRITVFG